MIRSLSLFGVLVLFACSSGPSSSDAEPAPTALVSVAKATGGSVAETQAIYGSIEQNADTQFTLAAPADALVAQLVRAVGSPVARGDAVVTLRPSPTTRATLAQNQADARSAELAYERATRLRADGLVSDAEVQSARATAQGARAQASAVSAQTAGLILRAPGAGYVQSIAVSPGDLVAAGATVATISQAGDLRARFGIDPAQLQQLRRGAGLRVQVPGGGPAITVPIQSVDPSLDPKSRLASVFVKVPSRLGLGAGQPLMGTVTLRQIGKAVTIPYAALLDDGGQPYAYVVQGGVAYRHDVVLGPSNGERVAIVEGLTQGAIVVIQGGSALEDGLKVRTK